MIKTVFYFRKPFPGYHSIEELFGNIVRHLPEDVAATSHISRYASTGIIKRIYNLWEARKFQQEVNHITGDIHYITYFLKKRKTILTIHDLEIVKRSNFIKRYIILFFWFYVPIKRVKYITVISTFTKQELLKYLPVPEHTVKVIPDCIPGTIDYSPRHFNSDYPKILQIGTKTHKNIPNLVEAIKNIPCKLIILGQLDPDQIELLKWNRINYENYYDLSYEQVIEIYKQIDLVAFVSTYEGFGLPILEAQAVGRPIVTSNIASMPEVAGDGAYLVNPHSVSSIREGITRVIRDEDLRSQLITAGLENVKRYTPTAIAEEYAELYREVVRGR
jgi:glycosyltransferase involved in cell wall biosynthesis